ncbi:hypothetical protein [Pantoea sp. PNT03]|uniref:hypothetical protein n=1 Tax=Pantoea sp. PNT03 TaxID=2769258 RepID=UPI00177C39C1|nr:hypothetical protein [Pantoea sp. PNT03]MBD9658072.1 hypothetical protein [Pantoea sp. PNT03]
MEITQFELVHPTLFNALAHQLKFRFPDPSLLIEVPTSPILDDLSQLNEFGKINWVPRLVIPPYCEYDYHHPVRFVVYYRTKLVGYVFGGYNDAKQSLEVHYMEKVKDAHADLYKQFLPLTIEVMSAYACFLKQQGLLVDRIALVNPVSNRQSYYLDSGFELHGNYDGYCHAMVLSASLETGSFDYKTAI